ncbi:MAG: hypothetical protein KJ077_27295 [Anaerolineae bacterium]|nr:hypothetical protein [Anaerolineae bacterium]
MSTTSSRLFLAYKLLLTLADEAEDTDCADQQHVSKQGAEKKATVPETTENTDPVTELPSHSQDKNQTYARPKDRKRRSK